MPRLELRKYVYNCDARVHGNHPCTEHTVVEAACVMDADSIARSRKWRVGNGGTWLCQAHARYPQTSDA